tara:strand:- start:775 stop:1353 length:579 start_codon:yes stop_codon:yes gene_type:complete
MSSKTLIIYEYQTLFEILNEIKLNLNFEILNINQKDFDNLKIEKYPNYLVISQKKQKKFANCLTVNKTPIKLDKLIENINVKFLKNEFANQSELKIGKYKLNLNSREIVFQNKILSLTERETNLITFISSKKKVDIKDLQKNVWGYSSNLETHTVETHIYRLRKKMSLMFKDENFISHDKNGYSIDEKESNS